MIAATNVSYHYPSTLRNVIDGFSMTLGNGCVCGLLGENGVGKTTMLGLFAGLLRPQKGSVTFAGTEVSKRDPEVLSQIYFVQDEYRLPAISLSAFVKSNSPFYPNFDESVMDRCLLEFNVPKTKDISSLSLGQRKKVVLSFALATRVKLLLLDEPTNGLDIPSKTTFRKLVASCMTEEQTIVISTHQVHDVEQMLDHVAFVSNNGILLQSSIEKIASAYQFRTLAPGEVAPNAIYSENSIAGLRVIEPRQEGDPESVPSLELLFNAVVGGHLR